MEVETENAIKVFFPSTSLVHVLFEAIANAIDARADVISIVLQIQGFSAPETLRIKITDNGTGFTDESFARFEKLLSPLDEAHKGLGRLVYLHYFSEVAVDSIFNQKHKRIFTFNKQFKGENSVQPLQGEQPNATSMRFVGFRGKAIKSYEDLKPGALKQRILQQFLPTLLDRKNSNRPLTIEVSLETAESNTEKGFFSTTTSITLDDLPNFKTVLINDPIVDMFEGIEMSFEVKPTAFGGGLLLTAANIDGRTIQLPLFEPFSVPPNWSIVFLFTSRLFDGHADSSRQRLILDESISESDLLQLLRRECGKVLSEKIPQINERNTTTRQHLADRFPHLLGLFDESTAGLINADAALEIAQRRFFRAQKEVLQIDEVDERTYQKSIELSSRALTEYVLYRERIIRRMKEITRDSAEVEIHDLICPRYQTFERETLVNDIYRNNAWLLDDKFMSFRTILSEARMNSVIEAISDKESPKDDSRPDITLIFSADPKSSTPVDVVVVELKKKTEEEKENQNALNQLLQRARRLAAHCPNIQRIWYYAIIQIDDEMEASLLQQNFTPMFSMGKVFYNEYSTRRPDGTPVPTPTLVLSFDAVVADAECRNQTFLDLLKVSMKNLANSAAAVQIDK